MNYNQAKDGFTEPKITVEDGALPEKHEMKTAHLLKKFGPVKFLSPVRIKGAHTPDILWQGFRWEIKSPEGKGRNLIHNTLKRAVQQSENIIIDLHRMKIPDEPTLRKLESFAPSFKKIKRLKVITKKSEICQ